MNTNISALGVWHKMCVFETPRGHWTDAVQITLAQLRQWSGCQLAELRDNNAKMREMLSRFTIKATLRSTKGNIIRHDDITTWLLYLHYWPLWGKPPVSGGFPSQRVCNTDVWYVLCYHPEQTVEHTVELLVIWGSRHCDCWQPLRCWLFVSILTK